MKWLVEALTKLDYDSLTLYQQETVGFQSVIFILVIVAVVK